MGGNDDSQRRGGRGGFRRDGEGGREGGYRRREPFGDKEGAQGGFNPEFRGGFGRGRAPADSAAPAADAPAAL